MAAISLSRSQLVATGIIVAGLLFIALYTPISDILRSRRNMQLIEQLVDTRGDVSGALATVATIDYESRLIVLDTVRSDLIKYFKDKAEADIDEKAGHYDYVSAQEAILTASQYYPDSAELSMEAQTIAANRFALVNKLTTDFNSMLNAHNILPGNVSNITDVIKQLRIVDPTSSMLKDLRLTTAYADLAKAAIKTGDYPKASAILTTGLDYSPTDPELQKLRDQVKTQLKPT